ncbi:MAG: GNAT family N-acetyltransferase [Saprospiraceae bacterium]|nr:GNAT family N-acetyltransferase [Saprospiraceae bacterium]
MSKKIVFDKDCYRSLCRDMGDDLPIFYRDWWLDAVCGQGEWEVMLYLEDPQVVAIYTIYSKRKGPFTYVSMPPLTKFMGPYMIKPFSQRKQQKILSKMVDALPRYIGFDQTMHYQVKNWLPFYWAGYHQNTRYSFVLPDIGDLDGIWKGISTDYRNNKIKKASEQLAMKYDLETDLLISIFAAPFERQQTTMPIQASTMKRLFAACAQHDCGQSFYIEDQQGEVHAALYLLWDKDTAYLLLSGESQQWRSSGGGVLLTWCAIKHASTVLRCHKFDFLGGMSENLERTRRQFGAVPRSYHYIKKWRGPFWWISHVRR